MLRQSASRRSRKTAMNVFATAAGPPPFFSEVNTKKSGSPTIITAYVYAR